MENSGYYKIKIKEVKGFKSFDERMQESITTPFTGFAAAALARFIMSDQDSHDRNIGTNNENKVVNIDAGHTFQMIDPIRPTPEILQHFPWIPQESDFNPNHWFGANHG